MCLCCRTPDEVTVFEALLTLLGFPTLVFVAYKIDQFEAAAARRRKHLVETQPTLKPEGWVGFGERDDGKKIIPMRVLDGQGGKLYYNQHICRSTSFRCSPLVLLFCLN